MAVRIALPLALAVALLSTATSAPCRAQSNLGAGLSNVGGGFSSGVGLGWGLNASGGSILGNGSFGNGGLGGNNPNDTGFSFTGGGPHGAFRLAGNQGSTRGLSSTTSSVTVMDGHSGYFAAGTLRPFVTDVIPVVGDQPGDGQSGVGGNFLSLPSLVGPGRSVLGERLSRLRDSGQTVGESSQQRDFDRAVQRQLESTTNEADPRRETTVAASTSSASAAVDSLADIRRQKSVAAQAAVVKAQNHYDLGVAALGRGEAALARYHLKIAEKYADAALRPKVAERLGELSRK
jgi:hypothetical protein